MQSLLQDVHIGIRRLFRSRGFAAMAIGTLAIGIGANTAVFTLINAVQLRPLPFAVPERLVDLYEHNPIEVCTGCGVGTSYPNFLDWQRSSRSFSSMAAYDEQNAAVGLTDAAQKKRVARVSAELFPLLGVLPLRGRYFTREEEQASGAHVAVISAALAISSFGADINPVGRKMRVDGESYDIVGIMPEKFVFPEHADLWIPLAESARAAARNDRSIGVVARLIDGVTREQAAIEMTAVGKQLATQYPAEQKGWNAFLISLHEDLASDYTAQSAALLAAVSCVLLIACANLANLMLARASGRKSELAIRAALGATRIHLARQFLVETMLVALAGGALGLIVALWGVELLRNIAGDGLPHWIRYDMDWRVFLYALGVSVITGLGFGLLPARLAARASLGDVLKDSGRTTTGGRRTLHVRDILVVLQVAVAFVLVIAAGLLTKTMMRHNVLDMGYDVSELVRADLGVTGARYQDPQSTVVYADRMVAEIMRGRGVKSASMSGAHIINWPGAPQETVLIDDVTPERSARALHRITTATPSYFATIGLPLIAGRLFTDRDVAGSNPVAVVSQTLARSLWGEKPALNKHLRIGAVEWSVVGVVGDMRESPLGTGFSPLLYFPLAQHAVRQPAGQPLTLNVRTAAGASGVAGLIRSVSERIDRDVTADDIMTTREFLEQWQKPVQTVAILAAVLGAFACLLASIGIYGVISYVVQQRTHEIGIRMALGASVVDVLQMVLRQGLALTLGGMAIGLVGAIAVARLMTASNGLGFMLFGVSPTDPAVYALVGLGFLFVALLAAYLPAHRAARVDPIEALRVE